MSLKIRRKLYPKTLVDGLFLVFFLLIVPFGYSFHLFVSLPYYYGGDDSLVYYAHCIFSTYLLVNLMGNYVATYLVDPSIMGELLSRGEGEKWRLCSSCECAVPARTWHCNVCGVCIMKRDHHCSFTACCIGHHNERYFLVFLFSFMVACCYVAYFNAFYIKTLFTGFTWFNIVKIFFPLAILLSGIDATVNQLYRMYCVLSFLGVAITIGVFIYTLRKTLRGQVMYENTKNIQDYDLGSWKENLKVTLGSKWYLTWFLPFIDSPLPCDGIRWQKMKQMSQKSR